MNHAKLIAAGLLVPVLAFAADRLNVKTGLWEMATTIETQGMPPMPADVLAKMTPEQRAKMEAMLQSRAAAGPRTHTYKECITEKDLTEPFKKKGDDEKCTRKVLKSSSTSQEVEMLCTGEHPYGGKMIINTPTPESMNGVVDMHLPGGMTAKTQMKGRWLNASCKGEDKD